MSDEIRISDVGNENLIEDIRRTGEVYAYDESVAMVDWKRDADLRTDATRPMWEVYLDGTSTTGRLLHSTGIDDISRYIIGGKLILTIGEPGTFSFTITPHHILYAEIVPYKSTVTVYQEGVELFRGRVTGYTTDIQRQRQVECEGDLSYLEDIQISTESIKREDKKLSKMFEYFVNLYNEKGKLSKDDVRYIAPGEVSIAKANYNVEAYKWITPEDKEYKDVRSYIDEFIECFGGYLRTKRYDDGLVHLEYISGYTEVNDQTITYGENLVELSVSSEYDDLFTIMVAVGEEYDDDDGKKITPRINKIAEFTDSSVAGVTIHHPKSSHTLVWNEGLETYGRIIRAQSFSGIRNNSELKNRSLAFFRETIIGYLGNFSVKFVDRHWLDPAYSPVYLGQKVRIISAPHGIDTKDQPLTCMKIEYDFDNPDSVSAEFDIPFQPLADTFTAKYRQEQKRQEKKTSKAGGGAKKANADNEKQGKQLTDLDQALEDAKDWWEKIRQSLQKQINDLGGNSNSGSGNNNDPDKDKDNKQPEEKKGNSVTEPDDKKG